MADGYARVTGAVGVCSVHQGPGLTNTMTGLAEAAKSRTPVLVLAGETPAAALTSNFRIDQHDLVESVGAIADRVHSAKTAADDAARAYQRALTERRPVVLMLPIDIQPQPAVQTEPSQAPAPPAERPRAGGRRDRQAADLLTQAQRPAIIAGRGAVLADAGAELEQLGADDRRGPGDVRPGQRPVRAASRTRSGSRAVSRARSRPKMLPAGRRRARGRRLGQPLDDQARRDDRPRTPRVIQIDVEPRAIGRNRPADLAIIADAKATARR